MTDVKLRVNTAVQICNFKHPGSTRSRTIIFHVHVLVRGVMILVRIHGKEEVVKLNDPSQQRFFRKT